MELFKIENNIAKPTVDILLVSPFNQIWERDTTVNKGQAIRDFTYIEFMCSNKASNPFSGYIDEEERSEKIIVNIYSKEIKENTNYKLWIPDDLVRDAIIIYEDFLEDANPSMRFLKSARIGIQTLQNFFQTVDLKATGPKGNLLYKPIDVTRALKEVPDIVKTLNTLEEKVRMEVLDNSKIKGNKTINYFEEAES